MIILQIFPDTYSEERLLTQMAERPRRLMRVRGHQEEQGNEDADKMAKQEVWVGQKMHKPDIATPAGIRQAHPIHPKAPPHLKWSREAVRGLTSIVTDKGSQRQWLKEIGKTEDPRCVYPCKALSICASLMWIRVNISSNTYHSSTARVLFFRYWFSILCLSFSPLHGTVSGAESQVFELIIQKLIPFNLNIEAWHDKHRRAIYGRRQNMYYRRRRRH